MSMDIVPKKKQVKYFYILTIRDLVNLHLHFLQIIDYIQDSS